MSLNQSFKYTQLQDHSQEYDQTGTPACQCNIKIHYYPVHYHYQETAVSVICLAKVYHLQQVEWTTSGGLIRPSTASFSNLKMELHHFSTTNQNSTRFSADWNAFAPVLSYQLITSDYLIQPNSRLEHAKHLHASNVGLTLGLLHSKKTFFTCADPQLK